jgi:alpha-tubulin suppressor-like RCC1 family protein
MICSSQSKYVLLWDFQSTLIGFGDNSEYQMTESVPGGKTPTIIPLSIDVAAVSTGLDHTLFLDKVGMVYAVGNTANGKTGITGKTSGDIKIPTLISFPNTTKIIKISAGYYHSLILDENNQVYGFGNADQAAFGITTGIVDTPTIINFSGTKIVDILTCFRGALFMAENGTLYYTGNFVTSVKVPTKIPSFSGKIKHFTCSTQHAFLIDEYFKVYSWGSDGGLGRLGLGTDKTTINVPTIIPTLANKTIIAVAAGASHTLYLEDTGQVYSSGQFSNGRLGISGASERVFVPTPVSYNETKIVAIAANLANSLLLDEHGHVFSAGQAIYGSLGIIGQSSDVFTPTQISDPIFTCNGLKSNVKTVCSGHGSCISQEFCECNNYVGQYCSLTTCSGVISNSSLVCSSHGSCIGYNNCTCNGYDGSNCEISPTPCYGIAKTDASVCSGHGSCIGKDLW